MLPIKPHLWFDQDKAPEAAAFYASLLPGSAVNYVSKLQNTPSGDCDVVEFTLAGQAFLGISAGPSLKFTPAISFMIHFYPPENPDAAEQLNEAWSKLVEDGTVLMPLDSYPFSERYGWLTDRYGLSWQLILASPGAGKRPVIVPSMMFTGQVAGRAEEAIGFYCSIFKDDAARGITARYPAGMPDDKEGTLMYADYHIDRTWLAAMDSAHPHGFGFNVAASMLVPCETQEEIDYYWSALTAGGEPGQCGWLKDKFGVSWQVASTVMFDALKNGTPEQIDRVGQAFMRMSKVDMAALQRAYEGE